MEREIQLMGSSAAQLPTTAQEQATALLQIIKEVALTPGANIDAMKVMMDMQRQLTKDQAERALNGALANLNLPHVKKNGKIPLPSKDGPVRDVSFAKWEDIDTVIRPLLRAEGLSLSFTAPPRTADGGGAIMIGRLSHRDGAFIEAQISLALDTGPGRNNLQAMGSTIAYGKKYLAFMLLNIVTEGQDDDGTSAEFISVEQAADIDLRLRNISEQYRARFLKWAKVEHPTDINAKNYPKIIAELDAVEAKARQKKGAA